MNFYLHFLISLHGFVEILCEKSAFCKNWRRENRALLVNVSEITYTHVFLKPCDI
jgi:hypothetical protein